MKILPAIQRAVDLLSTRDRKRLTVLLMAQIAVSMLDLVGIIALGVVAALSASFALGTPMNTGGLSTIIGFFPTSTQFIIILAFIAATLFVTKSLLSLWVTRRSFRFIANRQAMIAGGIAERLLNRPLLEVQARSSQEISIALSAGVNAITIGTIGPAIVIASEISLVTALFVGLLFVDPIVAGFTMVFFGLLGLTLQRLIGDWASRLGTRQTTAEIGSLASIQHALRVYREVTVSGRRDLFISKFQNLRWEAANVQADTYILSQIGKYVFEIGMIVGGGLLVLLMAATTDVVAAITIVTVFLAASSRIFPSLLRLQTAMATVRNSEGAAVYTYRLISTLNESELGAKPPKMLQAKSENFNQSIHSGFPGFKAQVEVSSVTLKYPEASDVALDSISLSISPGQSVALVGATGAGKSTLADIILGVLVPNLGTVTISGVTPLESVRTWPGALAYVPQDVAVLTGSVRENVALGVADELIDDERVWEALERAHLASFLNESRDGIKTIVGENGVQLSGGQRQRLGIARALYSRPKLLVLDEATSALDAETEQDITQTLESLAGEVTRIVIAHRLATIRYSDLVVYLDRGRIIATGTFDQVRISVPDFDKQAAILGM